MFQTTALDTPLHLVNVWISLGLNIFYNIWDTVSIKLNKIDKGFVVFLNYILMQSSLILHLY